MRYVGAVLCVLAAVSLAADERPMPDIAVFTAQVKAKLATDESLQNGYVYNERTTTEKLDSSGRTIHTSAKLMEVYPGLPGDAPYRRVIEEDGHPVSAEKLAAEDRKRTRAVEAYANMLASTDGRRKDAERRNRERREEANAIDDIFRVYAIELVGRETLDRQQTIVATLTPKLNTMPQTDDGKMMRHFHGRAWISEMDYELVRVEIEALDDLTIGWGLFARVHKGAYATYQRRKINNEIWLPAEVTWTGSARVLLLKQLRERGTSNFFGYRKFSVETSTDFTAAAKGIASPAPEDTASGDR
ncbi:MAG TPA: hypothetical protein VLV86_10230 [Vicinamibacterales bacterium]|nr:hypothetical protein [Vicinamibacterales bacterium]